MPRKTELRLLSERPAPDIGDEDNRGVVEAFPSPPPPADGTLGEDILEILRKSHDRIAAEAKQATALASAAVEQTQAIVNRVAAVEDAAQATTVRAAKAEEKVDQTAAAGQAVLSQVSQLIAQERAAQSRQIATAGIVAGLGSLGDKLARVFGFAVERAPALLALAAAVWLWNRILPDPQPLQLVALGLFGAVVIAPAIWLGRCGGKPDAR